MTLFSLSLSFFLLMDSIGNVPIFISVLKNIDPKRQQRIIFRELIIALGIIIAFYFLGAWLLTTLKISQQAVLISGGIILFIIGYKMLFPDDVAGTNWNFGKEPFLVPLALPLVAGPAVLAAVMLYSHQGVAPIICLSAILIAWLLSTVILLMSTTLNRLLGERGISALEKLMGLILIMLAVQMLLDGLAPLLNSTNA
jgi:multiple antibiotic resistance protein